MAKTGLSLLAELEAGVCDERTTTTSLLQKCILLGGKVGSERLRDWARQELNGYANADAVPEYRRVVAPLCIDGATFRGYVTGQQISSMSLPEFARGRVTEDLVLANALGELEDFSRRPDDAINLQPMGAQELIGLWNHENPSADRITRLYWQVSRSTIAAVITGVRTALAELVAELLAAASADHQPPSKEAVDAAMHLMLTGNRNTITVVGSQTATNGPATITVTGSSEQAETEDETWWQRWRKRGLIIGLAAVVAAVAAVLQLYGWVPWK